MLPPAICARAAGAAISRAAMANTSTLRMQLPPVLVETCRRKPVVEHHSAPRAARCQAKSAALSVFLRSSGRTIGQPVADTVAIAHIDRWRDDAEVAFPVGA